LKGIKRLYPTVFVVAGIIGLLLIYLFFPTELYLPAGLLLFLPLILVGVSYPLITRFRLKLIRKQLYQIIQTLEDFDVDEPKAVQFDASPFPLFNELNEYLMELINRIRSNFRANKQFTQNASHELQTPLAIIKGNAEILLQSPNIKKKEMEALGTILQNVNRLSKLNGALILLTKIENSRFADSAEINFSKIVEGSLNNFKDIIRLQKIHIEKHYEGDFLHEMSHTLAETLINNLIQNAIRYNIPDNGKISISINTNYCMISNPGKPPNQVPSKMFRRFRRESNIEESLGLGLSIVQSICEQSNLSVSYTYKEDLHRLTIQSK
jgi:signal transduction histidine kinase